MPEPSADNDGDDYDKDVAEYVRSLVVQMLDKKVQHMDSQASYTDAMTIVSDWIKKIPIKDINDDLPSRIAEQIPRTYLASLRLNNIRDLIPNVKVMHTCDKEHVIFDDNSKETHCPEGCPRFKRLTRTRMRRNGKHNSPIFHPYYTHNSPIIHPYLNKSPT
jgi:hypothetical protein